METINETWKRFADRFKIFAKVYLMDKNTNLKSRTQLDEYCTIRGAFDTAKRAWECFAVGAGHDRETAMQFKP